MTTPILYGPDGVPVKASGEDSLAGALLIVLAVAFAFGLLCFVGGWAARDRRQPAPSFIEFHDNRYKIGPPAPVHFPPGGHKQVA